MHFFLVVILVLPRVKQIPKNLKQQLDTLQPEGDLQPRDPKSVRVVQDSAHDRYILKHGTSQVVQVTSLGHWLLVAPRAIYILKALYVKGYSKKVLQHIKNRDYLKPFN